jgi:5-oxoprolinase (ATP-hydrolysing) subunit A
VSTAADSRAVFLNVDAGELPDEPEALYELADLVSIAAGGHAGDRDTVRASIALAQKYGARVGVHPSFDDREGFGRRALDVPPASVREAVARQCRLVGDEATARGTRVWAMKPHGALYHAANRDEALAIAVIEGTLASLPELVVVGPPAGCLRTVAEARGLRFAAEGFADRGYDESGQLRPRGTPGALLTSPAQAAAQAEKLASGGLFATLCVHGDSPGAALVLAAVRQKLLATASLRPFPVE